MKKTFLFFAALLVGMTAFAAPKQQKSIVILYENDVHCGIDGYQILAGLRDAVADTAFVAVVSSGDFVQGGTAGAISKGQYVADIMREVGYDAITLGNHEFDNGLDTLHGGSGRLGLVTVNGSQVNEQYAFVLFEFLGLCRLSGLVAGSEAYEHGSKSCERNAEKLFHVKICFRV